MEASVRTSPLTADVRKTCIPILFAMTEHPDISDMAVLSPGDRIRFVQKHAGMPSINALARSLDLKRSENLYQILKGNNGISKDLACRIAKCFPWFSITWLMTGQGEPLMRIPLPSGFKELPLYTALNFENDGSLSEPDHVLLFPDTFCPSAEMITISHSDAMIPLFLPGDWMFLARSQIDALVFGQVYIVIAGPIRLCRIVRKGETAASVRLVSLKPEKYGELIIPRADIDEVFRLCGTFRYE